MTAGMGSFFASGNEKAAGADEIAEIQVSVVGRSRSASIKTDCNNNNDDDGDEDEDDDALTDFVSRGRVGRI